MLNNKTKGGFNMKLLENKTRTREEWLVEGMAKLVKQVFEPVDIEVPTDIKVSCGFPASGGRSGAKNQAIGVCHNRNSSEAGVNEIFISPVVSDSVHALDVLSHEMIHAVDDCKNGHKKPFKDMAVKIGLTGKMTATVAGDELKKKLEQIVLELGDYPHAEVSTANKKKQSTRNLKVECSECGFGWRASKTMIARMTNTTCNGCGSDTLEIV